MYLHVKANLILKISSLFGKKENLEVARTVLFLSDTVLLLKESSIKDFSDKLFSKSCLFSSVTIL